MQFIRTPTAAEQELYEHVKGLFDTPSLSPNTMKE